MYYTLPSTTQFCIPIEYMDGIRSLSDDLLIWLVNWLRQFCEFPPKGFWRLILTALTCGSRNGKCAHGAFSWLCSLHQVWSTAVPLSLSRNISPRFAFQTQVVHPIFCTAHSEKKYLSRNGLSIEKQKQKNTNLGKFSELFFGLFSSRCQGTIDWQINDVFTRFYGIWPHAWDGRRVFTQFGKYRQTLKIYPELVLLQSGGPKCPEWELSLNEGNPSSMERKFLISSFILHSARTHPHQIVSYTPAFFRTSPLISFPFPIDPRVFLQVSESCAFSLEVGLSPCAIGFDISLDKSHLFVRHWKSTPKNTKSVEKKKYSQKKHPRIWRKLNPDSKSSTHHFTFSPCAVDATCRWDQSDGVKGAPSWCSLCFCTCSIIARPITYR